jgi:hypothetical protein
VRIAAMRRPWVVVLSILAAAVTATCSIAATVPLGPLPPQQQEALRVLGTVQSGDLAYFPTVAPAHYVWGGGGVDPCRLGVLLNDSRFRFVSLPAQKSHTIEFTVSCFPGTQSACSHGSTTTLHQGDVKIYWDGLTAWRCIRTSKGRLAKISASKTWNGRPTAPPLGKNDLAAVVASAKFTPARRPRFGVVANARSAGRLSQALSPTLGGLLNPHDSQLAWLRPVSFPPAQ